MIDALCEASQAGVEIDLIIRGMCCLRPGVPGLSERIRVRSLVGRYLEHSRIYYFANGSGAGRPTYYIGSADLMERNLDRRVEALAPVEAPALQARLQEVLDVSLTDDVLAWQLDAEGHWTRVPDGTTPRRSPPASGARAQPFARHEPRARGEVQHLAGLRASGSRSCAAECERRRPLGSAPRCDLLGHARSSSDQVGDHGASSRARGSWRVDGEAAGHRR